MACERPQQSDTAQEQAAREQHAEDEIPRRLVPPPHADDAGRHQRKSKQEFQATALAPEATPRQLVRRGEASAECRESPGEECAKQLPLLPGGHAQEAFAPQPALLGSVELRRELGQCHWRFAARRRRARELAGLITHPHPSWGGATVRLAISG